MYSRLRTSLKQQGGNKRKTLKQRGGYASDYATPDEARKQEWIAASTGTPLETLVTALCNAPSVQTYIEAIAKQDDLFLLAHRLAFKDFIAGDAINIQVLLDKRPTSYDTTTLSSYINDVHKWVALKEPASRAGKLATLKNIPIQQIILYPNVLTNSFLSAVAACFVQMKQQKIVFSGPQFASMKEFYAFDFNGSTKELIYKQTRSEQRDGFYLGQTLGDVTAKMNSFWNDVIDTLRTPEASLFKKKSEARADYATETKTDAAAAAAAAAACKDFFAADSWGAITASLYMLYNETQGAWSLQTLLNAFFVDNFDATDKCGSPYVKDLLATYASATNVPPESDWNTPLLGTKTTLMMLLTQIDLGVLDFLLHLTQKITEVAAAAEPTS
jgi:hypothetical protein